MNSSILGFTWTDKLSLRPTIERCIGNIQRSLVKLKWLKSGRNIATTTLRQCFFAYTFPHFAWIFPFFPLIPKTHQQALKQKFRVGIRMVHRCTFIPAHKLYKATDENPLEFYVKKYIQKRLKNMHVTDLGSSLFYNDIFAWDEFYKRSNDNLGHFFQNYRVRQLKERHESFLLRWLLFVEKN